MKLRRLLSMLLLAVCLSPAFGEVELTPQAVTDYSNKCKVAIVQALSGASPETLPSVFYLEIWIKNDGELAKVRALDIFKQSFKSETLSAAMKNASFDKPPMGLPMPLHVKIKLSKES